MSSFNRAEAQECSRVIAISAGLAERSMPPAKSRGITALVVLMIVFILLDTLAVAQSSPPPAPPGPPSPPIEAPRVADDPAIVRRLEALSPENPRAYFELAEDIEDLAIDAADKALARQLYGLAGAISPQTFGRSACLALASMADVTDEVTRRKFRKLAAMLDRRSLQPVLQQALDGGEAQPAAALAVALALSEYRNGRGKQALDSLQTPGAMELLTQHEHLLRGGIRRFIEDCKLYTAGSPPTMSEETISQMLRAEAALLSAPAPGAASAASGASGGTAGPGGDGAVARRTWSGDLLLTRHRPLVEVDPQRLDEAFEVDVSRPVYRDGTWTALADANVLGRFG